MKFQLGTSKVQKIAEKFECLRCSCTEQESVDASEDLGPRLTHIQYMCTWSHTCVFTEMHYATVTEHRKQGKIIYSA